MKTSEYDVLVLPGLGGGSDDHWYSRWARGLATVNRVEQADFDAPDIEKWTGKVVEAVEAATQPVVLIGHSAGVLTAVATAPKLPDGKVVGAFLVAPPDVEATVETIPQSAAFMPISTDPLPFPSYLVASRNDPYCAYEVAEDYAAAWGSLLLDAGDSGHINDESGHGPWPEGLMLFGRFLKLLGQS